MHTHGPEQAAGSLARPRLRGLTWVPPVVAATVLVGVAVAVLLSSQHDVPRRATAAGTGTGTVPGSILGSWRLVAATGGDGHTIPVPTPSISITFQADGSALVLTGVNAITLTVQYEPAAITARFRLSTAAYDGSTDPNRLAVLRLLDSLAPSAAPAPAVRSSYQVHSDHLKIQVPAGTLECARTPSTSEQPAEPSNSTAASTSVQVTSS